MELKPYQRDFIELLVRAGALKFGDFTLKSGRRAPYFLNVGSFHTGELMTQLARFYAAAIRDSGVEFDVVFGPAYKGIPLSVAITNALFSDFHHNVSYCFNRKEVKDHGEGSLLVGAPLSSESRVILVDDVITAGTAIRDTLEVLKANGDPQVKGVFIALNRMEKNNDGKNALAEIEETLGVPVYSIVTLDHVLEAVTLDEAQRETIRVYRTEYGI